MDGGVHSGVAGAAVETCADTSGAGTVDVNGAVVQTDGTDGVSRNESFTPTTQQAATLIAELVGAKEVSNCRASSLLLAARKSLSCGFSGMQARATFFLKKETESFENTSTPLHTFTV